MELDKIINELMEKRFNDKVEEIIQGKFDKDKRSYSRYSDFDDRLRWFCDTLMDEYLEKHKEDINKIIESKINLSELILEGHTFRLSTPGHDK